MSRSIYKGLPDLERKQNGYLYQLTPSQHRKVKSIIYRECCSYEDGNCVEFDDGESHICVQCHTSSIICKWFRFAVLPLFKELEAEIFKNREVKRCVICGKQFVPKSNRSKYCQTCAVTVHRRQKTKSEQKRRSNVDN